VTFYEAILSLIKAPREAGVKEVFELSDYYSEIGDWQKAAETRLRMKDYTTAEPFLSNAEVEAARMYLAHGQTEKADALYQKAQKSSYGWAAGMALWDEAQVLIQQKKYEEARKLLNTPVTGQYSEQIKIALLSLLSQSYYLTSDFEMAHKYAQQTIAQADGVELLKNEGIGSQINAAETIERMSKQWEKQPIVCEPNNISFTIPAGSNQPISRWLLVQTHLAIPIKVEGSNSNIQVSVNSQGENVGYFADHRILVQLNPAAFHQNLDSVLSISSPVISGFQLHVPIQIRLEEPIHLSEDSVFFGGVKPDATVEQTLILSSPIAFHVLSVTSDNPAVAVHFKHNGGDYEIGLKYTPAEAGKISDGEVRIQTDMPNQKVIIVPYVGFCAD